MTVRVVERPEMPQPVQSRCKCGALLEFERSDIRSVFSRPGESYGCVQCPHCKNDHYFDMSSLKSRAVVAVVATCATCGRREDDHNVRHIFVPLQPRGRSETPS